jgi:hypothetical protein
VLDDHFLVVASALGSSPFGEVLWKGSKYFAGSKVGKVLLPFVLGGEDVLVVMDK